MSSSKNCFVKVTMVPKENVTGDLMPQDHQTLYEAEACRLTETLQCQELLKELRLAHPSLLKRYTCTGLKIEAKVRYQRRYEKKETEKLLICKLQQEGKKDDEKASNNEMVSCFTTSLEKEAALRSIKKLGKKNDRLDDETSFL